MIFSRPETTTVSLNYYKKVKRDVVITLDKDHQPYGVLNDAGHKEYQ